MKRYRGNVEAPQIDGFPTRLLVDFGKATASGRGASAARTVTIPTHGPGR